MSCNLFAGNATVDERIGRTAGTQTHSTVHTARGFAGSVQARDQTPLNVIDLCLFVGVEIAHSMVNLGRHTKDRCLVSCLVSCHGSWTLSSL